MVKTAGSYRRILVTLFLSFFSFDHELKNNVIIFKRVRHSGMDMVIQFGGRGSHTESPLDKKKA